MSHPEVGQTLSNLGLVYGDQGKYVEAEALLRRASAREQALGTSHPAVGQSLNNLGLALIACSAIASARL